MKPDYLGRGGKSPCHSGPTDADIIWRFEWSPSAVFPHDASNCFTLVHGDVLYVGTANGVDNSSRPSRWPPA